MRMSMSDSERAARTKALPDIFAGRVPEDDLVGLRSMAGGGEWGELLDLLIAALRVTRSPVSAAEIGQLHELLTAWGLPTEQLTDLLVRE